MIITVPGHIFMYIILPTCTSNEQNSFHVTVRLFCGRRSKIVVRTLVTLLAVLHVSPFCFLPHLEIICNLLLDRCSATIDQRATMHMWW